MLGAVIPFLGTVGAPASQRLVGPGSLGPGLSLTRTHAPGTALATRLLAGGTLGEAAAGTPRFTGGAQRLLLEPARTNAIRNPRAEGAAPGVPGSLPTGWSRFSFPAGIATEVTAIGTEGGIPHLDLRVSGTPATNGTGRVQIELGGNVLASTGQSWAASLHCALAAGSLTNLSAFWGWYENDGGGAFLRDSRVPITPASGALPSQRHVRLAAAGASAAQLAPNLSFSFTAGAAVDATLRIGLPQMEQGAIASSAILPAAGTLSAATRGADSVTGGFASIFPGGAGTLLLTVSLARVNAAQQLVQLDANSNSNRLALRATAGATVEVLRTLADVTAAAVAGTVAAETVFRAGIAFNGAGRIAASVDGAAAVAVTGGPTAGLTLLRLGDNAGATQTVQGEFGPVLALPYALGDAALAAAVAAL